MELTELLSRSFRSLIWIFEAKSLNTVPIAQRTRCLAPAEQQEAMRAYEVNPLKRRDGVRRSLARLGFCARTFWCEVQVIHRVIVIQKNAGFDSPWAIAAHRRWFSESSHCESTGRKLCEFSDCPLASWLHVLLLSIFPFIDWTI